MKKILLFIAVVICAVSCDLKEQSFTEASKDNYFNNAAEAQTVLNGVYRNMSTEGMYSYYLSLLFTISTDIAQCEGSATTSFRVIPTNSHNASTTEVGSAWATLYKGIYGANEFIETTQSKMGNWSETDRQFGEIYIAEARVLRALFNFELVRWWGNIVLVKSTADSRKSPSEFKQAAPIDVYQYIEQELLEAAEILPWATDDDIRQSNAYRVSKGAALGLLTKVYCTWAGYPVKDETKWAEAAKIGRKVVESGKHSLNPSYEKVWYNTCNGIWDQNESLIEVSFYSPTGINGDDCVGRIGKWNGVSATAISGQRGRNAANWKVCYPFVQEWETHNDPRLSLSVADYKYTNKGKETYFSTVTNPTEDNLNKQRQLFTPAKWDTEKYVQSSNYIVNNDKSNVNWYVLRYSDVLLLYAEAVNEAYGATDDALAAINLVRERAFGNASENIASGISQEDLREAIRKERAYELCFEGHRKQDLIRWGIYYKTIKSTEQKIVDWYTNGNYTVARFTIEGRHELMPIPQRELDLMTQCNQNEGWGQ